MSSAAEAKEGLGSLGLELQAVVNLCVGAENWTQSREGAASVLTSGLSLKPQHWHF